MRNKRKEGRKWERGEKVLEKREREERRRKGGRKIKVKKTKGSCR